MYFDIFYEDSPILSRSLFRFVKYTIFNLLFDINLQLLSLSYLVPKKSTTLRYPMSSTTIPYCIQNPQSDRDLLE